VWDVLRQTVPTWLCVGAAGGGAFAVYWFVHPLLVEALVHPVMGFSGLSQVRGVLDEWAVQSVTEPAGAAAGGGFIASLTRGLPRLIWERRLVGLLDLMIAGSVFVVLAYGLLRALLPSLLREAVAVLPARLGFLRRFV
jgi:hypothetical protein